MTTSQGNDMVSPISARLAIVTGGGNGIGVAIATRLAQAGHSVGVLDLDETAARKVAANITEQTGMAAVGISTDVSSQSSVRDAVEQVRETLGPVTILVNNAGITRDNLLFKMPLDDWDAVMAVHLRGSFLMSQEVQQDMVDAGWGRIVTMSSVAALGNRGQVNYAAAKAGLQAFSKTVALELGPFGVTANVIAPGFIETDMTARTAERLGMSFDAFKAQAASAIPVRRVGQPEDVASLANYLCSDESGFLSGQVIYLAGGPRA